MKRFLTISFASIIFIFTFNSCKKRDAENINLTGHWQLKNSVGGFGGGTVTPEKKIILILNRDSTYAFKEDGTIKVKGIFHVTYDSTHGNVIYLDAILEGFLPGSSGEIYTIKHRSSNSY